MSFYPNLSKQDLINLSKLAEQQKNQRAIKIKNKVSRQKFDKLLAEPFSFLTNKLEEVVKTTKNLGEVLMKINSGDENTQTTSIENATVS